MVFGIYILITSFFSNLIVTSSCFGSICGVNSIKSMHILSTCSSKLQRGISNFQQVVLTLKVWPIHLCVWIFLLKIWFLKTIITSLQSLLMWLIVYNTTRLCQQIWIFLWSLLLNIIEFGLKCCVGIVSRHKRWRVGLWMILRLILQNWILRAGHYMIFLPNICVGVLLILLWGCWWCRTFIAFAKSACQPETSGWTFIDSLGLLLRFLFCLYLLLLCCLN